MKLLVLLLAEDNSCKQLLDFLFYCRWEIFKVLDSIEDKNCGRYSTVQWLRSIQITSEHKGCDEAALRKVDGRVHVQAISLSAAICCNKSWWKKAHLELYPSMLAQSLLLPDGLNFMVTLYGPTHTWPVTSIWELDFTGPRTGHNLICKSK